MYMKYCVHGYATICGNRRMQTCCILSLFRGFTNPLYLFHLLRFKYTAFHEVVGQFKHTTIKHLSTDLFEIKLQ